MLKRLYLDIDGFPCEIIPGEEGKKLLLVCPYQCPAGGGRGGPLMYEEGGWGKCEVCGEPLDYAVMTLEGFITIEKDAGVV